MSILPSKREPSAGAKRAASRIAYMFALPGQKVKEMGNIIDTEMAKDRFEAALASASIMSKDGNERSLRK